MINIFAPGMGTVLSGLIEYHGNKKDVNGAAVMLGFLQLLLSQILIGWIWAIYHSYC